MSELDVLGEPFATRLASMYAREDQKGLDGVKHPIDGGTMVTRPEGLWLFHKCLEIKAKRTLEIGMAYGYSTMYLLAANRQLFAAHHTAIDPYQHTQWSSIGLACVAEAETGLGSERFRFICERSEFALAELHQARERFDLIFIDGEHLFEGVLTDFYLSAQLLSPAGFIVFHDRWMPSVLAVRQFIKANRSDFQEVSHKAADGVTVDFVIMQRVGVDMRPWHNFVPFKTA